MEQLAAEHQVKPAENKKREYYKEVTIHELGLKYRYITFCCFRVVVVIKNINVEILPCISTVCVRYIYGNIHYGKDSDLVFRIILCQCDLGEFVWPQGHAHIPPQGAFHLEKH